MSLSHNTIHIQQRDEIRGIIIGTPLVLVAVFCFGLFMLHPTAGSVSKASDSKNISGTQNVSHSSDKQLEGLTSLPLMKQASAKLPSDDSGTNPATSSQATGDTPQANDGPPVSGNSKPSGKSTKKASSSSDSSGSSDDLLRSVLGGVLNGGL